MQNSYYFAARKEECRKYHFMCEDRCFLQHGECLDFKLEAFGAEIDPSPKFEIQNWLVSLGFWALSIMIQTRAKLVLFIFITVFFLLENVNILQKKWVEAFGRVVIKQFLGQSRRKLEIRGSQRQKKIREVFPTILRELLLRPSDRGEKRTKTIRKMCRNCLPLLAPFDRTKAPQFLETTWKRAELISNLDWQLDRAEKEKGK